MSTLHFHHRRAKPLLGTLVSIETRGLAAHRAVAAGFEAIAQVQRHMSRHEPDSDIARLNAAPVDTWVTLDASTLTVLALAAELHTASHGAFDCTRCTPDAPVTPIPAWRIKGNAVYKCAPVRFDLGGIAKGYAVDCAIDAMRVFMDDSAGQGIDYALVNAGGDLRHIGAAPTPVALREPGAASEVAMSWPLRDAAIASSVVGGLSPDDATPRIFAGNVARALHARAGASVLAPTCMLADALTKIVLVRSAPTDPLLERYGARTLLYCDENALAF